jgi:hypothetical protein
VAIPALMNINKGDRELQQDVMSSRAINENPA